MASSPSIATGESGGSAPPAVNDAARLDAAGFGRSKKPMRAVLSLILVFIAALAAHGQPSPRNAAPKPPDVSRDLDALPPQVRRMRGMILDAVRTGDSGALRKPIEWNEVPPSFGKGVQAGGRGPAMAGELIKLFRERSGDGEGRETMGQLLNVLAVGYARVNAGSRQEMFIWPYFAALDPRLLSAEQEVDAYRVLHASAVREWREKGRYPGWRLGIGPDGTWHYFSGAE
jgi:hypothetical protein